MGEATNVDGGLELRREDLDSAVAVDLIRALNAELDDRYPEEGANHFQLDPVEVEEGSGVFLVALVGGHPVGCGALRRIEPDSGELKRMYIVPEARGRRIGLALLRALEAEAQRMGLERVVLETGERQHESVSLYEREGYRQVEAFGDYVNSPMSLCMAKELHETDDRRSAYGKPFNSRQHPTEPSPRSELGG